MKKLFILPLVLLLGACSSSGPKVLLTPELQDRAKFVTPEISPAQQLNVEWVIINRKNFEQKIEELEKKNGPVSLFALTPQGYQNLSINIAELRRYIQQQNANITALKKYYEEPVKKEK